MHNDSDPAASASSGMSPDTYESVDTVQPARSVQAEANGAIVWFSDQVKQSFTDNLINLTVYGPAVTSVFDAHRHQIHTLIVVARRDVDQLLKLAQQSKAAAGRRIAPPLIVTQQAMRASHDVFPLEWIDIAQFHATVIGESAMHDLMVKSTMVRLQCERELRSLDILLQRGLLATGGDAGRLDRLERDAADGLVRVFRGIGWLVGERQPLLPGEVCERCAAAVGFPLTGASEAIRHNGRHDVTTVRAMLEEIGQLTQWVDRFKATDL